MKLHVTYSHRPANLEVIEKVLGEFNTGKIVELCHASGVNLLVWDEVEKGMRHSLSIRIPEAWLENVTDAPNLEATTRNFADCVANFAFPQHSSGMSWSQIGNASLFDAPPHTIDRRSGFV